MNIQQAIKHHQLELLFQQGTFGIEKESQRITADGQIVTTPHPAIFGNRAYHPYIQTDFAESQLELITPPQKSVKDSLRWLSAIHEVVLRSLPENEYISPFSMPLVLPEEQQIQVAQLDNPADVAYREHLVKSYGKYKQMISGIHYNFQLSDELIERLFAIQQEYREPTAFRNALYLKLGKNFLRYQWILVYLFAASPSVEPAFYHRGQVKPEHFVRSLRSSHYGYVNHAEINVSYESLQDYVATLEHWVKTGKLIAEKEFYSNIRFRGAKKQARELLEKGIRYVEFRLFDLNPFAPYGIELADAEFIHAFILLMLWLDTTATQTDVELGQQRLFEVALEHPLAITCYQQEGLAMLQQLERMLVSLGAAAEIINTVKQKQQQLLAPETTICGRLVQQLQQPTDYHQLGADLAKRYKAAANERYYALRGFENMELSTQALMFDLIQQGINVEILDENDQFLCLQYGDHIEYVKNGNMTAKDSYISPLIMENKVVTKKVLAKGRFNVPQSLEFSSVDEAVANYPLFEHRAVVIKPKSTNFGLGITIFKQGVSNREDFRQAIEIAFAEDKEVMVEDYLVGTEYRFFVLGDQTLAVLLREPANVIGDGKRSVAELVAAKNQHPLRGDGSRTPLKKIALGEIEKLQLKEQGLTVDSVPKAGRKVQLRANSNISTGGDSIDMTDLMHPSYKAIAVDITKAMGAAVCGVDLIVPDYRKAAEPTLASWGVIEANFNPMMMMHIFPYQGKSRRLTKAVIKMLFPELN